MSLLARGQIRCGMLVTVASAVRVKSYRANHSCAGHLRANLCERTESGASSQGPQGIWLRWVGRSGEHKCTVNRE